MIYGVKCLTEIQKYTTRKIPLVNCPLNFINNTKNSMISGMLGPKTKLIIKEYFFFFSRKSTNRDLLYILSSSSNLLKTDNKEISR